MCSGLLYRHAQLLCNTGRSRKPPTNVTQQTDSIRTIWHFVLAISLPISYYLSVRTKGKMAWVYRAQMLVSVVAIGPVKRSHYREATKLAYTDFYCYNPDSLNDGSGLK
jgi:hypothetical protein